MYKHNIQCWTGLFFLINKFIITQSIFYICLSLRTTNRFAWLIFLPDLYYWELVANLYYPPRKKVMLFIAILLNKLFASWDSVKEVFLLAGAYTREEFAFHIPTEVDSTENLTSDKHAFAFMVVIFMPFLLDYKFVFELLLLPRTKFWLLYFSESCWKIKEALIPGGFYVFAWKTWLKYYAEPLVIQGSQRKSHLIEVELKMTIKCVHKQRSSWKWRKHN